mgnify:FL=1
MLSSLSHYDMLLSSGQLVQIQRTIARMSELKASCTSMIEQFRLNVQQELSAEKQAALVWVVSVWSER